MVKNEGCKSCGRGQEMWFQVWSSLSPTPENVHEMGGGSEGGMWGGESRILAWRSARQSRELKVETWGGGGFEPAD